MYDRHAGCHDRLLFVVEKSNPRRKNRGFFYLRFAVFADLMKSALVGAPLLPTLRIFSPEPFLMRSCFALMLA